MANERGRDYEQILWEVALARVAAGSSLNHALAWAVQQVDAARTFTVVGSSQRNELQSVILSDGRTRHQVSGRRVRLDQSGLVNINHEPWEEYDE